MKKFFLLTLLALLSFPIFAQDPSYSTSEDTNLNDFDLVELYDYEFDRNRCSSLNFFQCQFTPNCRWDLFSRRCEENRYRPLQCNRIYNPRQCMRTPGCDWDRRSQRCDRRF